MFIGLFDILHYANFYNPSVTLRCHLPLHKGGLDTTAFSG